MNTMTGIHRTPLALRSLRLLECYGEHIARRIGREKNAEGLDRKITDRMCRMMEMETRDVGTGTPYGARMDDASGIFRDERHAETFRFYSKARASSRSTASPSLWSSLRSCASRYATLRLHAHPYENLPRQRMEQCYETETRIQKWQRATHEQS